ncbi:MAG: protein kinase domain-containing protein, partial [Blastocatellia bacterium]
MFCPHCGDPSDNKRFCTQCGRELLKTQVEAEPVADPASEQPVVPQQPVITTDALTGRTLDQKYYLESKLGAGGMGTVYCARRLLIGDRVAVKVLHPNQVADPQAVERFRREAQTAARLKHPNVVTIYDFGVSGDSLIYLVMELVEGDSLRQLIKREGTLSEGFVAEVVRQTCAALDEAHRQGVVHRDIKPENVLAQTTPSGARVKVLDFGIAALRDITASRLTRTGGIVGTPHYMSPEHCLGEKLDGRSDIYSLGIVMFELLTGVAPFDSTTPTAIVIQQVNQ